MSSLRSKIMRNKYDEVRAVWKLLGIIPAFFLLMVMLTICFAFFYGLIFALTTNNVNPAIVTERFMTSSFANMWAGILQNVAMISLVILFWKLLDKKPMREMGLTFDKSFITELVYGLVLGAVSIALIFFILLVTGQIVVEKRDLAPDFIWVLLADLVLMIFVGIGEEMFSRGYCMSIMRRSNIFVVLIVPNVIFALLHILNNNIGVIPLINLFLIGVLFSFMFLRRGNIWMPIGYHITWNYFQGSIFGMPVSGTTVNGLYMSRFTSDNILNGGGFGPEGGLIVTGLIIVSIVLLLLLTRDKKENSSLAADSVAPTETQL